MIQSCTVSNLIPNPICPCSPKKPNLLQVKANNICNGNCKFCIDRGNYRPSLIDVPAMVDAILSEEDYPVVDITGGEPLINFDTLIQLLIGIRPYKKEIILNTNGSLLTSNKVAQLNGLIDELHIALHHYVEEENSKIIGVPIRFKNLKNALINKEFTATFNMVITESWLSDRDEFIDHLVDLCYSVGVDGIRISEMKYIGENHGYEEYAPGYVAAYQFFEKLNVIRPKTPSELITQGCFDIFDYRGIHFLLKRLCGFKFKSPVQTFKAVYSDGRVVDDWEWEQKK